MKAILICCLLTLVLSTPKRNNEYAPFDTSKIMCGPNALWQAATLLGKQESLCSIVNRLNFHPYQGVSMYDLVQAAEDLGLHAKPLKTDLTTIKRLSDASSVIIVLLKYEKISHYVILDTISQDEIRFIDSTHFSTYNHKQLRELWEGYAILLSTKPINVIQKSNIIPIYIGIILIVITAGYTVSKVFRPLRQVS